MKQITKILLRGGWTIHIDSRKEALKIAEKIQNSDTELFIDQVILRYGGVSIIIVKGDSKYENELKEIVANN